MGCPPLLWTLLWRSKFRFTSFRRKVIVGGLVLLLGTAVFAWWLRRRIKHWELQHRHVRGGGGVRGSSSTGGRQGVTLRADSHLWRTPPAGPTHTRTFASVPPLSMDRLSSESRSDVDDPLNATERFTPREVLAPSFSEIFTPPKGSALSLKTMLQGRGSLHFKTENLFAFYGPFVR